MAPFQQDSNTEKSRETSNNPKAKINPVKVPRKTTSFSIGMDLKYIHNASKH
ncbi:MAG: hypothetical protein ACI9WC_002914 [Arenicella sp.]|jgi:hypothetical protein